MTTTDQASLLRLLFRLCTSSLLSFPESSHHILHTGHPHSHLIRGFIPAVRGICAEEIAVKGCLRLLSQPRGSLKLPSDDKKCECCSTQGWMRSISFHHAAGKCGPALTLQLRQIQFVDCKLVHKLCTCT